MISTTKKMKYYVVCMILPSDPTSRICSIIEKSFILHQQKVSKPYDYFIHIYFMT